MRALAAAVTQPSTLEQPIADVAFGMRLSKGKAYILYACSARLRPAVFVSVLGFGPAVPVSVRCLGMRRCLGLNLGLGFPIT